MKLSLRSPSVVTVLAVLVLASCGPSKNGGGEEESANSTVLPDSVQDVIKRLISELPSPHEIPYMLQATGAEFNQNLLNNRKKADDYLTRNDKAALNLGVYVADIGYQSSYDKTQEAIDYLNAVKMLADNLGVMGFDPEMLSRIESNISNKDSLATLIDQAIKKTNMYLVDGARSKLAVMIITGSFTEGLYISTGLVKSYPKDLLPDDQRNLILTPMIRVILDQEASVDKLVELLGYLDQSEPIAAILADLKTLKASYKALNINEQIKNNKANLVLSSKNLEEITRIVDKLRTFITD